MTTEATPQSSRNAWRERVQALKNVPPVLGILWRSGPSVVTWGLVLRVLVAALPAAIAYVAARIINGVQQVFSHQGLQHYFWWLVVLEAALNVVNGLLARCVDYSDSLLADRYTHFVSIRVMRQAAELDLTTYEDPVFYDRLERARVQATDRLAMIQQMGRLFQQSLTTLIWTSILLWYSPWLVLLLALGVLPTFLGETHFAFLGYAKNFRQTPAKRQMDYLRQVAGSREGAKELKLFNLKDYLTNRFTKLSQAIYEENVALSRKKLLAGGLLGVVATLGYYGAYAFVIWRAVTGSYNDIGEFYYLTNAIIQASSNLQQVFSTASGIADQALFLTDLLAFFEMKPTVVSKPDGALIPRPIRRGFEFRNVSFAYPRHHAAGAQQLQFHPRAGAADRADWRKRPGQDDRGEADHPALRPNRRADPARWHRPSGVQTGRSAPRDRGDFSGLHALRDDRPGKHQRGPGGERALANGNRIGCAEEPGGKRDRQAARRL